MTKFNDELGDVAFHQEPSGAILVLGGIVPGDVDAGELGAGEIVSDCVMIFEDVLEMLEVTLADVFDARIVNDEDEGNGPPLVAPEPRSCGRLVVAMFGETFAEEVVCKSATHR